MHWLLNNLIAGVRKLGPRRSPVPRARHSNLGVEALEDRLALSTTRPLSGLAAASSWSAMGNPISPSTEVSIIDVGNNRPLPLERTLSVREATLFDIDLTAGQGQLPLSPAVLRGFNPQPEPPGIEIFGHR